MATYYGSTCKTDSCGGHKAGARYVREGGRLLSTTSDSFDKGMRIQQSNYKKAGKVVRLRT